jgi:uncharacterized protein
MAEPAKTFGPVQEPQRISALDALRGAAIFGIFMVNIAFFAGPFIDAVTPSVPRQTVGVDAVAWGIVKVLFELKFISTFSLLFGMGMVVQMQRAEAKGVDFAPVYLRRTFVLMVIGFVHAFGLWYGDILFLYSWVALVVLLLRKCSARLLLWLGLGSVIVPLVICSTLATGSLALEGMVEGTAGEQAEAVVDTAADETETDTQPQYTAPVGSWERFTEALEHVTGDWGDTERWREVEVIAYRDGPLSAALLVRSATFGMMCVMMAGGFIFRIVGMFLLGAAFMKFGFFEARRRPWHRRLAYLVLPLGLVAELGVLALLITSPSEQFSWHHTLADFFHQLGSFALCLGYVGGLTLLATSRPGWLLRPFEAVGRLALSNYLLQTVVSTTLFYWWGFGLFDRFGRAWLLLLVLAVYAVQVAGSGLYLRFFKIGPMEWLWRSLTYLKPQPWVRR